MLLVLGANTPYLKIWMITTRVELVGSSGLRIDARWQATSDSHAHVLCISHDYPSRTSALLWVMAKTGMHERLEVCS